MKKIVAILLSITLLLGAPIMVQADGLSTNENGQSYLVTGADLNKKI